MEKFRKYLSHLGHDQDTSNGRINSFSYSVDPGLSNNLSESLINVDYFYFRDKKDLFYKHLAVWNENNRSSFIAVFDDRSYIIDCRFKPSIESPLTDRYIIRSFDYGVETVESDFSNQLQLISREGIDNTYYFDFVIEHQKQKKASEVDKDLLLNLLELRNDLITPQNENTIHLLLLRCLFVKYLEDRGVFEKDFLHKTLSAQSPEKLITAFKKVRKINGDLFKSNELRPEDLQQGYLHKLSNFFGYYDYRSKQGKFFPYQFDKIPIELISNIYESFLKDETKKGNGVYYTPSFLVNFMLTQTLSVKIKEKTNATLLDPACGSGTFLVEAFRILIKANNAGLDYEKKKQILQTQLFGIDLDERALQIAAFSLYLALLEGEKPEFIQEKIRTESPILPGLIGKTLIKGNALTDPIQFDNGGQKQKYTFDCIVANPPWGSVPVDNTAENINTRKAIGNKAEAGTMAVYQPVSDFQRSQAFLLRSAEWSHDHTITSMVVNNSIFLNENAEKFRKEFLKNYGLEIFYELSEINDILFRKHKIGEIQGKPVEIGANEPCCVLVYNNTPHPDLKNSVKHITPTFNKFTESLRLITYGTKNITVVIQEDLIREDLLWRIFVHGGWADYQVIAKRLLKRDQSIRIECRSGFQPKDNMQSLGKPEWRLLIDLADFKRYSFNKDDLTKFNWNQKLHRKRDESIFEGERIIIPVRPLSRHGLRFSGIRLQNNYIYKDNILCIKITKNGSYVNDYRPYLAIINSKFIGYFANFISSQWGKGEAKRSTLRNSDFESLPFPEFEIKDNRIKQLNELVSLIEKRKDFDISAAASIEKEIDELVYDLYHLTTYERILVNEFFEINLTRKQTAVSHQDLETYAIRFSEVFQLMLNDQFQLFYTYTISPNMGACICFIIRQKEQALEQPEKSNSLDIINLVKLAQTGHSYLASVLAEEKVKYYDKKEQKFYIIKSNQFKEWTERQAIDDANEEIGDILKFIRNIND
jgi:hypothetical protein